MEATQLYFKTSWFNDWIMPHEKLHLNEKLMYCFY